VANFEVQKRGGLSYVILPQGLLHRACESFATLFSIALLFGMVLVLLTLSQIAGGKTWAGRLHLSC
jgi:hypothetical protein